ncbi:MAG: AraC family transcriptional regulator [Acidobacteriota bacterium]
MLLLSGPFTLISFGVSALLSGLLWFDRERRPETRFLAYILGIHAMAFLLRYGFVTRSVLVVYLPFLVFPLLTLHGPLVELFVRRSLFDEPLSRRQRLPFLLGPPVFLGVYALIFLAFPEFRDREAILAQTPPVGLVSGGVFVTLSAYGLAFWIRAVKALRTYRERFQANFSNLDSLRLEFLRGFTAFIAAAYLSHAAVGVLNFFSVWSLPVTPVDSLLLLVMTYLVLHYLVRRPQIFALPPEAADAEPALEVPAAAPEAAPGESPEDTAPFSEQAFSPNDDGQKYARQSLDSGTRKDHLSRVQAFMAAERPYLDGELALADLADAVGIPKHHLSMAINIELEQNFFQFVNAYRVEEARRLLADPSLADENILTIAYRAGFQSKASFNKVFKQSVGQTPGQFRKAAAPRQA